MINCLEVNLKSNVEVKQLICYIKLIMRKKKIKTMADVFANPRFQGKHVVLVANNIYTAKTGQGAAKILDRVLKKYPQEIPEVAYLPKAHSLILGN